MKNGRRGDEKKAGQKHEKSRDLCPGLFLLSLKIILYLFLFLPFDDKIS